MRKETIGTTEKLRCLVEKHGLLWLRFSVGIVFVWFGFLKFFPGSAAENLATDTISWLTFDLAGKQISLIILAIVECAIGLSILSGKMLNIFVPVMYLQLLGTILPLFVFPEKTWNMPFVPSLAGQYIIKNLVLISCGIVFGAIARGSKLITHPDVAREASKKEALINGNN